MTTATSPIEVDEYLAVVRTELGDLPTDERDDLLAEVESSLRDAASEGGHLTARLGPPEEFAAELRAAAGLERTAPPRTSRLVDRLNRIAAHPSTASLRGLGRDLAPIWWALRGYLAVGLLAYVLDLEWSTRHPLVPRYGSAEVGAILIVLALVASVWLGLHVRRHRTPLRRTYAVANSVLAVAILPVSLDVANRTSYDALVAMAYAQEPIATAVPTDGVWNNGTQVSNIYPFTRDGKLLRDVLLYDGAGRPIEISGNPVDDPDRRFVLTNGGQRLFNVFPIRYYEPGTKRVARPNAAPYIEHPLVLTPLLPSRPSP
jgi:hypothetical protein